MKKHTILAIICLAILSLGSTAHAGSEPYVMELGEIEPLSLSETTDWLQEHAPEILQDMDTIREIDPELHEEMLMFASEEIAFAEEIREIDPKALDAFLKTARMEVHSELLGAQYRAADNASQKKQLKKELLALTRQVFDARMEEHNAMVADIERELKDLKRTGDNRSRNRDKIIERRIEELTTEEADDLGWW